MDLKIFYFIFFNLVVKLTYYLTRKQRKKTILTKQKKVYTFENYEILTWSFDGLKYNFFYFFQSSCKANALIN